MKKLLAVLLIAGMLAGCSSSGDTNKESTDNSTPQNEEVTSDTTNTLPVEGESQNEADADHPISVIDAINDQDSLVDNGTVVSIEGYLPQNARVDEAGNEFTDIQASLDTDDPNEWIQIANSDALNFGGCKAVLTGTLSYDADGILVLNVTDAKEIDE